MDRSTGPVKDKAQLRKSSPLQRRNIVFDSFTSTSLKKILEELGNNNLDEQEIWEGAPQVYQVLEPFKETLIKIGSNLLTTESTMRIIFPKHPKFTDQAVAFRIPHVWTAGKVVSNLCHKYGIDKSEYKNYRLSTLKDYTLDDTEVLSTFGYGVLLQHWELQLTPKRIEQSHDVHIKLPSIEGLPTELKVEAKPSMRFGIVLFSVCKTYKLNQAQFTFASLDGIRLRKSKSLEFYGLGTVFSSLCIQLVQKDKLGPSPKWHSQNSWITFAQTDLKIKLAMIELDTLVGTFKSDKERILELEIQNEYLTEINNSFYEKMQIVLDIAPSIHTEVSQLQTINNSLEKQVESLMADKDKLEKKLHELPLDERQLRLSTTLSSLSSNITNLRSENTHLSELNNQNDQKISNLQNQIQILQTKLQSSVTDYQKLENQFVCLGNDLKRESAEKLELGVKVKDLEKELDATNQKLKSSQKVQMDFVEKLKTLKNNLIRQKQDLDKREKIFEAQRKQLTQLDAPISPTLEPHSPRTQGLEPLFKEIESLNAQKQKLEQQNRDDKAQWSTEKEKLESNLKLVLQHLKTLQEKLKRLETKISKKDKQISKKKQIQTELESQIKKLQDEKASSNQLKPKVSSPSVPRAQISSSAEFSRPVHEVPKPTGSTQTSDVNPDNNLRINRRRSLLQTFQNQLQSMKTSLVSPDLSKPDPRSKERRLSNQTVAEVLYAKLKQRFSTLNNEADLDGFGDEVEYDDDEWT